MRLIRPADAGHLLPQAGEGFAYHALSAAARKRHSGHGTRFWAAAALKNEALSFGVRFRVA